MVQNFTVVNRPYHNVGHVQGYHNTTDGSHTAHPHVHVCVAL